MKLKWYKTDSGSLYVEGLDWMSAWIWKKPDGYTAHVSLCCDSDDKDFATLKEAKRYIEVYVEAEIAAQEASKRVWQQSGLVK